MPPPCLVSTAACFLVATGYKLIHDLLNQEAGRVKPQEIKGRGEYVHARRTDDVYLLPLTSHER